MTTYAAERLCFKAKRFRSAHCTRTMWHEGACRFNGHAKAQPATAGHLARIAIPGAVIGAALGTVLSHLAGLT